MIFTKKIGTTLAFFTIICQSVIFAQKTDSISPGGHDLIETGIKLYDDDKYDEAIATYNKVSKCDPNFAWAKYEIALALHAQDKFDSALVVCKESQELNEDDVNTYILQGSILDNLGRRDEGITFLNNALKRWPYNERLIYNLAVCYMNKDQLQKAEELLISALKINPYHIASHLALGKVNYMMGRMGQTFLAYSMATLINPSVANLNRYENIISGKQDSLVRSYLYPYPVNSKSEKWIKLSQFANSGMAFNDNFPYPYKINYMVARQSLMIFKKMKYEASDSSFYNQCYVKFFEAMMDKDYFEMYLYHTLQNSGESSIAAWLKSHKNQYDKFIQDAQSAIRASRGYNYSIENELLKKVVRHYNENGDLSAIGNEMTEPNESKEGSWIYIDKDGEIIERCSYVNNLTEGSAELYWNKGKLKQKLNFKNDKLDGENVTFYPNGAKSGIYPRAMGVNEGIEEQYTPSGKLVNHTIYLNNKKEGKQYELSTRGCYSEETPYKNNKIDGVLTQKWINGKPKLECNYVDSLLNGVYKKWYANGKPESVANYTKDEPTGKFVTYHPNGIIKQEYNYNDSSKLNGKYLEYDINGNLISEVDSYKNGVVEGIETIFYPNKNKRQTIRYKEGDIVQIECFDLKGKSLYAAEAKNGEILYKSFYMNGSLKMEGKYRGGEKEGNWITYNAAGTKIEDENWKEGMQSGWQRYYYENGNLKTEFPCDSNQINGNYRYYHENGKLQIKGAYAKGETTGEWTRYYQNDTIESETYYSEGNKVGRGFDYSPNGKLTWIEYYNESGESIKSEIYYPLQSKPDILDFEYDSINYVSRYTNGKIRTKVKFCDRQRSGLEENFYPNGKPLSQLTYILGQANGLYKMFDPSGKLDREINYTLGKFDGVSKSFDRGVVVNKDNFILGDNTGLFNEYYPNGKIYRSIPHENDKRNGTANYFASDSTWLYSATYENDAILTVSYRDNAGKIITKEVSEINENPIISYFPNGKIGAQIPIQKGIYNGAFKMFYPNGNLARERTFVNNLMEGESKIFYENGVLKSNYLNKGGDYDGYCVEYYPTGIKQSEGHYICNKRIGEWIEYDKLGKRITTMLYDNDNAYDCK